MVEKESFERDENKNRFNQKKHDISFKEAQYMFYDSKKIIAKDLEHSVCEERYYCFGKINENIVSVLFTYRNNKIRISGAGYWRKGNRYMKKKIKYSNGEIGKV